jgi:transposase
MDEARFGLKVWHRRRWCPTGHRPPWKVEDRYEWTWLYVAVEPATGESFSLYMPHLDGDCFEIFLAKLRERYPGDEIVLVLDGAGAHRNKSVAWPDGVEGMPLPAYSPELNPAERWFEELRARLSNCIFETTQAIEEALTEALRPFWEAPEHLARLTGYGWWIENISSMPTS